jgi:AcrR family transcriptional regulator
LTYGPRRRILLTVLGTPSRDRVAERREATRQEILAAAWEVSREVGVAQLTLRQVAERVGMRAPSLYSHFDSKHAIYDAMFGQGWEAYLQACRELRPTLPDQPRARLRAIAHQFFDYSVADPAWFQLLNQRLVPGFTPSPESYAPSVTVIEMLDEELREVGITDPEANDLWVAVIGGLVESQLANDPGGDRYQRLLDRAVEMYADHLGLPAEQAPARKRKRGSRSP